LHFVWWLPQRGQTLRRSFYPWKGLLTLLTDLKICKCHTDKEFKAKQQPLFDTLTMATAHNVTPPRENVTESREYVTGGK
jgi:hypothetical protein